jgi:hypothetical protein
VTGESTLVAKFSARGDKNDENKKILMIIISGLGILALIIYGI